jgi:salicylate hydroxylase/6-hydroxynicotinate 3-monooxygenase
VTPTRDKKVAIIGAGLGGLAAAIALRRFGFEPVIFEQARAFGRVGAGINVSPNATKVLRGLGVEADLLVSSHQPDVWLNREASSGDHISTIPLGEVAEERYGAKFLQMHRAELHEALAGAVPRDTIHLGKRLVDLTERDSDVVLTFEDGTVETVSLVVGADGIHSRVRQTLFGDQPLRFTGRVAYRSVIDGTAMAGVEMRPFTKWWGNDRHIVIYYVNANRDTYFVTSVPDADWRLESWSARGDVDELRSWFTSFHPEVREVLGRCTDTHKWALYDREPLDSWHSRRVVLLGDATHPMTPYLAQGAAMAIEDGVVLARALAEGGDREPESAFRVFQANRWERTSAVQSSSGANRFGLSDSDPGWLYSYDAWQVPLSPAEEGVGVGGPRG